MNSRGPSGRGPGHRWPPLWHLAGMPGGAHVTRGTTPNFAAPCGYSKEGGDGETDSDQLHWSHRMWMELAGRGRGGGIFRSLRSRASGRRLVTAGGGSSLLTSSHGATHGLASEGS